jgi:uncharacterized membrane protein YheB (UPF0754 family)
MPTVLSAFFWIAGGAAMFTVISMIAVGAIIGFGTNLLAIVMLFRPWTEWRFAGWKVPLTPGLIPKRQGDIAKKLGEVVEEHLVTEEGIVTSLSRPEWILEVRAWLVNGVDNILKEHRTIRELYRYGTGKKTEHLQEVAAQWGTAFWQQTVLPGLQSKQVRELLPASLEIRVRQQIPVFTDKLLDKATVWIDGPAVRKYLASTIQEQLLGKGMLGKMAVMFVQEDRIVSEVIPHLQNWLGHPSTSEFVQMKLAEEWERLLDRPAEEVLETIRQAWNKTGTETGVETGVKTGVETGEETVEPPAPESRLLAELVDKLLDVDLFEVWTKYLPTLSQQIDGWIKSIQSVSFNWVKPLLESLRIRDMVERQVASFPIPKLERIVIDVVRKELSMITWLGALLGGLIGLIQALLLVGWR